jgi:hypothetical protein
MVERARRVLRRAIGGGKMTCTCQIINAGPYVGLNGQIVQNHWVLSACEECKTDKAVGAAMRKTTALAELIEKMEKMEEQYKALLKHRYERETGAALIALPMYFHLYQGSAGYAIEDQDDESMYLGKTPLEAIEKATAAKGATKC